MIGKHMNIYNNIDIDTQTKSIEITPKNILEEYYIGNVTVILTDINSKTSYFEVEQVNVLVEK